MKKIIAYSVISLIVSGVVASCTGMSVPSNLLNTLYTVAGVLFSVGMSIAISPKTEEVTNMKMKQSIRFAYKKVQNTFMILFAVDTVLFVLAEFETCEKINNFVNLMCLMFIFLSVVYFIWNFKELQKFGRDIEDQVLKEKEAMAE